MNHKCQNAMKNNFFCNPLIDKFLRRGFLLLLLVFSTNFYSYAQRKRALLIAIGNYPRDLKWGVISSNNDVPLIKESLGRQGFEEIAVLNDEKATKLGILSKFEEFLDATQKGDVVLIHFSSHGRQVEDLYGDEEDGLDESIVCYDAPVYLTSDDDWKKYLLDDELAEWILKFRCQAGEKGDVLLIADSCFSGSIGRNLGGRKVRGGRIPPLSITGKEISTSFNKEVFMSEKATGFAEKDDLAPFVVIAASASSENNSEFFSSDYMSYGSLSFAFCKVLNNASSFETYRGLFGKIQLEMKILAGGQTPEIEGILDRKIWGGAKLKSEPYYSIKKLSENEIEINAGSLHGVLEGSKVELFPLGSYSSQAVNSGVVIKEELLNATVKLMKSMDERKYWASVSEKAFGDVFAKVTYIDFEDRKMADSLLKSYIIKFDKLSPDISIEKNAQNQLILRNVGSGMEIGKPIRVTESLDYINIVKEEIEKYVKAKFLLGFNPYSEGLNAHLQILPSPTRFLKDTVATDAHVLNGLLNLDTSQYVFLKVVNESDKRIYYNLLDIDLGNNISVVIPDSDDSEIETFFVEARSQVLILNEIPFRVRPPFGPESLKLFISDQPIGLRNLRTRSMKLNPLEKVFDLKEQMATRSTKGTTYPGNFKASSYTLNFNIVP